MKHLKDALVAYGWVEARKGVFENDNYDYKFDLVGGDALVVDANGDVLDMMFDGSNPREQMDFAIQYNKAAQAAA